VDKLDRALLNGRINGSAGLFVIDTASSFTFLNKTFADRIGVSRRIFHYTLSHTLHGSIFCFTSVVDVAIANLQTHNWVVSIQQDRALRQMESQLSGPFCDGLVGADILWQYRGIIDFAEKKISFCEPGQPAPMRRDEEVVARLLPIWGNMIAVETTVDGFDALLIIDTGTRSGKISIDSKLSEKLLKVVALNTIQVYAGGKIRGVEGNEVLVARKMEINGVAQENVPLLIDRQKGAMPRYEAKHADGFIGLSFFVQNNLIIDYGRMEIRRKTPSTFSTSGQTQATSADSRGLVEQPR
jgi:hypothetical protein